LKAYDPRLRVVWSDKKWCWRVERRLRFPGFVNPAHFSDVDDQHSAQEGYMLVFPVGRHDLDDRVFMTLYLGDLWRRGGANKVADELEAKEAAEKARQHASFMDDNEYRAREYWTSINTVHTLRDDHRHSRQNLSINNQ
jgi:hypothetical protein